MVWFQKHWKRSPSWFQIGLIGIFLVSLGLRFWGLSRFNTLVFDEVHFAKFATSYLHRLPFLENHPPLGKYFIAIGIWLSQFTPFAQGDTTEVAGFPLTPFSYRWMNAWIGSFVPVVVAGLAYQLTYRRSFALIAGSFAALDGLLLVESRYALINIYLVLFGLLGQWLLLLALERSPKQRGRWLIASGVCFGASVAVKWNGLGFLLGVYLLWIVARIVQWLQSTQFPDPPPDDATPADSPPPLRTPLQNFAQLRLVDLGYDLAVIPLITYFLIWLPHLNLNTEIQGFWEWQKYLLGSHKSVGSGADTHPYCSAWYTWPLLIRPVGYYFEQVRLPTPAPSILVPSSPPANTELYYDVHAIGNPMLWWLSTGAIALLLGVVLRQGILLTSGLVQAPDKRTVVNSLSFWLPLYLGINYIANLLPWALVTRCTFLYHYMGSALFSLLAIAWLADQGIRHRSMIVQAMGAIVIFLIVVAFLFWLPIFLGLPLAPVDFQSRMWFRSWY